MKNILFTGITFLLVSYSGGQSLSAPNDHLNDQDVTVFSCHQWDWYSGGFYIYEFTDQSDHQSTVFQVNSYWQPTTGHGLILENPFLRHEQTIHPFIESPNVVFSGLRDNFNQTVSLILPMPWNRESILYIHTPLFRSEMGQNHGACVPGPVQLTTARPRQSPSPVPQNDQDAMSLSCMDENTTALHLVIEGGAVQAKLEWDPQLYFQLRRELRLRSRPPDGHNSGFWIPPSDQSRWECRYSESATTCENITGAIAEIPEAATSVFGSDSVDVNLVELQYSATAISLTVTFSNAVGHSTVEKTFSLGGCTQAHWR